MTGGPDERAGGEPAKGFWEAHVLSFRILHATVTAVPAVGEIIFHAGLDLMVTEGREETSTDFTTQPPPASTLEPFCRVTISGAPEPTSWSGVDANIVVSGTHENGTPITVVGPGSIGQDDNGSLEIAYAGLPRMSVLIPPC